MSSVANEERAETTWQTLRRGLALSPELRTGLAGTIALALVYMVGRVAVPVIEPGMAAFARFAKASGLGEFSHDQLDLFVHGRVVDTRALTEEFGFRPRSSEEAFADFLRGQGLRPGSFVPMRPDALHAMEASILAGIRAIRSAPRARGAVGAR